MNKFLKVLMVAIFVLTIGLFQGCKKEKFNMDETFLISNEELDEKIVSEEFFMFVLLSKQCENCFEYEQTIKKYVQETNEKIYYVDIDKLEEKKSELENKIISLATYGEKKLINPSIVLVNNGKIKDAKSGVLSYNELKDFAHSYIKLTFDQLMNKINEKETFKFVIKSITCKYSKMYEETVKEYTKKNNEKMYYINIDDLNITSEQVELLLELLKTIPKYEDSELSTPTTVIVKDGVLKDAMKGDVEYNTLKEFLSLSNELTFEELQNKIDAGKDFIFIIRSDDCAYCNAYNQTIKKYKDDTGEIVYYLNIGTNLETILADEELKYLENILKTMPSYEGSSLSIPTTVIVKKGKYKDAINGNISYDKLIEFVSGYIKLTMSELERKIELNKDFIFIVKSRYCSHCNAYEPIVKEYAKNAQKVIYYLDVADSDDISLDSSSLAALRIKIASVNADYDKLYTPVTVKVNKGEIIEVMIGKVGYNKLKEFIE